MKLTEDAIARLHALELDGRLTPAAVVADAKLTDSPLHDLFDWNVEKAAEQHWLDRGRAIIRLVKVVVHTDTTILRAPVYVRDPDAEPRQQGYIAVDALRQDPATARRALRAECERMAALLTRAKNVATVLHLEDVIDEILSSVTGLNVLLATAEQQAAPPPS